MDGVNPSPEEEESRPHQAQQSEPVAWPVPLARITTCGGLKLEVLQRARPSGRSGESDPRELVYGPSDATLLAKKGASTALLLLALLASQPAGFATKDFLSEHLRHIPKDRDEEEEHDGLKRVDNVVCDLRHLLFPPLSNESAQDRLLRRRLVTFQRASQQSGPGYQLAGLPLVWLDVEAIGAHIKRAKVLEQFGEDGLTEWRAAYDLASQGLFLPGEIYSDWASARREAIEGHLWDCTQALWRRVVEHGEAGQSEAIGLLRRYWQGHKTCEDALRPLLELLGKRECFGEAETYYQQVCQDLEEEGRQPDRRTREVMDFLRALQIQRKPGTQPHPSLPEIGVIETENPSTYVVHPSSTPSLSRPEEAAEPAPSSQLWSVPHLRNPFFTGRETVLARLHNVLHADNSLVAVTQHALCGLGGIGKTQVALEYAYRYRQEYQAIFWVKADTRENLLADFLVIASLLHLPEQSAEDRAVTAAAVKHWFQSHDHWLLILDNADEVTLVREFLPSGHRGHILFTTRMQAVGGLAYSVQVEEMDQEIGALFLLRRAGLYPPERSSLDHTIPEARLAQAFVQEVGGLPLALDQAGAYIEETAASLQEYVGLYHTYRLALLERRGGLTTDHPESVATTWALAFTRIEHSDSLAADLLHLCAFLDPDAIPEELLFAGLQQLARPTSELHPLRFNEAIGALLRFSLVKRNGETRTLTVHRLVQSVIRDNLPSEQQRAWIHRVVHLLAQAFPSASEVTRWSRCEQFLPHALLCAHWMEQAGVTSIKAAALLDTVGFYLNMRARYDRAEPLFQRALCIREQVLGEQHPDTAQTLSNLAYLYHHQDQFEEAMHFLQRSLFIRQHVLGMDHPDTATSLNALALLHHEQGRYEEAEAFYQQALALRKQIFGTEHLQTAHSLSNLAWLYRHLGKYQEAEQLYEQSLFIRKQIAGVEHPDTATSLNGLALLYAAQKQYAKAQPLFQQAVTIRQQVLGSKHLHTTQSMNALALLYRDQGEYEKAEVLFLEVLAIREQILGSKHPRTVTSMHNLAFLYYLQGKFEQAEPLFQRALLLREHLFGRDHPRTQAILNHLIRCQREMKKP